MMDPQACLDWIANHLDDGDLEEAAYLLDEYRRWRAHGGFEPPGGDERARLLGERLRQLSDPPREGGTTP
jgi:hypothetical protein